MSQAQAVKRQDGMSDLVLAAGVVLSLALGASLTYWLSAPGKQQRARPKVVEGAPLINSGNAPTKASSAAPVPEPTQNGDFLNVPFETLASYLYEIPSAEELKPKGNTAQTKDQIPAPVRALNKKKVAVLGFMVPLTVEKGATKSFLLVRDQSLCCFGRMPRMNEWISVKMAGNRATKFIGDQPITVFGTIDVGEEIEKGEVLSIYRMEAEDVAGPLDL